jgi:hypothetical protein
MKVSDKPIWIPKRVERNDRPQRGAWAPGDYLCRCIRCKVTFIGDKRAVMCADCAYEDEKPEGLVKP